MSAQGRWRTLLLYALGLVISGFTILRGIGPHDEGLMLQAGARIADGQWPYRDFWTNYPPGQPLLLAGLVKVFGASLLPWRIVRVLLDALIGVLVYRLVGRGSADEATPARERIALLAWLAGITAMAWPTGPGPNPPAIALGLGAILLVGRRGGRGPVGAAPPDPPASDPPAPAAADLPEGPDSRPATTSPDLVDSRRAVASPSAAAVALSGALLGLAVLFRLEIGVACAVGALLVTPAGTRVRLAAWTVGLAVLALAPFAIAAGGAMWDDTIGFLGNQGLQRLPLLPHYGGGADPNRLLEWAFPALLLVAAALWLAWALARRPPRAVWALAPLALFGVAYLLGRTDEFHLVPLSLALAGLLGVAAAHEFGAPARAPGASARALGAWRWALVLALAVLALHGVERRIGQLLHPPALVAVPGGVGDGVETDPADAAALRALIPRVRALTPAGQSVLVVPPRLSQVTVGDPLLYVLLGRPNPTGYDVMQPGVVTTAAAQREMIGDLERDRTPVVVRWEDPRTAPEPNGGGREHGSTLLDAYLSAHYRRVARYGPYVVYQRAP